MIVVIGDLCTDVVARMTEPLALGSDASAQIWTGGGGSGANVAAWLAYTGTDVMFCGRVGGDENGHARRRELEVLGVQPHLVIDGDHPTGTVVVLVGPDGERTMLPDRGANRFLAPPDLDDQAFTAQRHLHLSGYTLFDEGSRAAAVYALRLARDAGMTISVDPSSAAPLRAVGAEAFLDWTAGADICLPNVAEALALTGTTDATQALQRLAESYGETVITLGGDGAVWSDGDRFLHVPALPAAVVDTTGAGDAFSAGYLAGFMASAGPQQRLEQASALAARAVAARGARP